MTDHMIIPSAFVDSEGANCPVAMAAWMGGSNSVDPKLASISTDSGILRCAYKYTYVLKIEL